MKYHPDRYQTQSEIAWATKKFLKIKQARDVLVSKLKTFDKYKDQKEDEYSKEVNYRSISYDSQIDDKDVEFKKKFYIFYLDKLFNLLDKSQTAASSLFRNLAIINTPFLSPN